MPARPPAYAPQLATLVSQAPEGNDWLHEVKYDGFRMGLVIDGTRVRLLSRNGHDWTTRFPDVIAAARALPVASAVLDGEVALLQRDGRTSFQSLQGGGAGQGTLVYFLFDALFLDGEHLSALPLEARKAKQIERCDLYREDFGHMFMIPAMSMLLRVAHVAGKKGKLRLGGIKEALPVLAKFEVPDDVA